MEFFTEVPFPADRKTIALAATGGPLTLDDGFDVTQLGVGSDVQNLWSQADVFANHTPINFDLWTWTR